MQKIKNKIIEKIKYLIESGEILFVITALLFFAMFLKCPVVGDDAVLIKRFAKLHSLAEHWDYIVYDFMNWSSRVIIDCTISIILKYSPIIWNIINSTLIFVLLKTLSKLFVTTDSRGGNLFITCIFMMYPLIQFGTAGWITTHVTYFWPIVLGFVSLIPIRKIYDGEKFKWWEYIIYSLSLIYSGNEEMELVVITCCYMLFFVYFMLPKNKRKIQYIAVQLILCAASLIFTFITPGNKNRSAVEASQRFPDFDMLNFIDKADLGIFTTLKKIIFDNYIFFIVICALIFITVLKKYKNIVCRSVAAVPLIIVVAYGPLMNITGSVFRYSSYIIEDVSRQGLVTLDTMSYTTFIRMTLYIMFAVCFFISLCIVFEMSFSGVFAVALLVGGTASRAAMGFSPTVWISGERTFSLMMYALVGIGVMVYDQYAQNGETNTVLRKSILASCMLLAFLSYINDIYMVYVYAV